MKMSSFFNSLSVTPKSSNIEIHNKTDCIKTKRQKYRTQTIV